MLLKNKRILVIVIVIIGLLFIPFIAMYFTNEVSWKLSDFLIASVLLFSLGLICEIILRKIPKIKHRIILIVSFLILTTLLWIELAVGIFGTPFAGT